MTIPPELTQILKGALPHALRPFGRNQARRLPPDPGSYVLVLRLDETLVLTRRFAGHELAPGWYAYLGSARGPGGLRARLSRHLRKEKKARWHVDQLTMRAVEAWALPFADASDEGAAEQMTECTLTQRLLAMEAFTSPLPGFGSSDCSRCASHLLMWHPPRSSS